MQLREFYARTLPESNHYCLFRSSTRAHVWAESLDQLVELTQKYADQTDTYFAVASFQAPTQRTQDNVELLKCFRLDLDAGQKKLAKHGEAKVYPTQQDAIADVVRFSRATGLVPSLIVSSGEGLHVYYELAEPVEPGRWRPVAQRFQKFGVANGLRIDSAVTADHARVLRPIGTLHPNGKRVEVLKATPKVYTLDEFDRGVRTDDEVPSPAYDLSINDDIAPAQGPPKTIKRVLLKCDAMRFAYQHQDKTEEPYWRAALSICKHTIEGRDAAHAISSKHPKYDPDDTDAKFERYEAGPALCSTFREFNPDACSECPHWGKIKSPIVLGEMTTTEVESLPEDKQPPPPPEPKRDGNPWDGALPQGFEIVDRKGRKTLVQYATVEKENDDGEMVPYQVVVPLTTDVFWFGRWADAENSGDTAQVTVHKLDGHSIKSYTMDQSLIASRAELLKYLAGKSIHMSTDRRSGPGLEAYSKLMLQQIKDYSRRPKIFDRFGLRILDSGETVCSHGKYLIYPDGRIEEAMLSPALQSQADSYTIPLPQANGEWDGKVWASHVMPRARQYVEFMHAAYSHKGMEKYQLAIMLALASPLMAFTTGAFTGSKLPPNGLCVSLYSRNGGKGKTTAMRMAATAYGNPDVSTRVRNSMGTTELARLAVLSAAGSLPVLMDEMGGDAKEAPALAKLVSSVANGSARVRLKQDGSIVDSPPWSLICTFSTNVSHREMIALAQSESTAIQQRLLELDVEDATEFGQQDRASFEANMKRTIGECAGALGGVIHLMICSLGAQKMTEFVQAKVAEADRITQSKQGDRFQYRALGAVMALQELLQARKLAPFDIDGIVRQFRKATNEAQQFIKENVLPTSGLELLSRALTAMQPHTVITQNETRRARYVSEFDAALNSRMPTTVKARHVVSTGTTYISVDALREWCRENRVRESELLVPARRNGVMRRLNTNTNDNGEPVAWAEKFNLLKGMRESTNTYTRCYAINTRTLAELTGVNVAQMVVDSIAGNVVQMPADAAQRTP